MLSAALCVLCCTVLRWWLGTTVPGTTFFTCNGDAHRRNYLRGTRGTDTLTFWTDWGIPYPTFQDEKVKNLLSSAANRGDLQRLNYIKTFPAETPPRTPLELTTFSQTPNQTGKGYLLLILLPSHLRPKGASFSFWIGTPTF